MTPHIKFIVKSIAPNVAGRANWFFIRILESYKDDEGLYRHELEHVKQFWMWVIAFLPLSLVVAAALTSIPEFAEWADFWPFVLLASSGLHSTLYNLLWKYRLWCEVKAYREQSLHYPDDRRPLFASFIHLYYNLPAHVTHDQIYQRLKA